MEMTATMPKPTSFDFRNQATRRSPTPSAQILTVSCLSLLAGPGSTFDVWGRGILPGSATYPAYSMAVDLRAQPENSFEVLLKTIREGWSLNMSELASLLGVTRPTLYNWKNGGSVANIQTSQHLQTLAAAADFWKSRVTRGSQQFLIDYRGPKANEESIRQAMSRRDITANELRTLIENRLQQYQEVYAKNRVIAGDVPSLPASTPPEGIRQLNALWSENAKNLQQFSGY